MWNFAKSAEAMFSRWAVKRVCKFLLKKKLGQFILGEIDLDQLDVQLTEGTIQLSDLALNAECLNSKLSAATSLYIKEGSIGSLLVRMPWKGKGCQVELDEFEVVLAPCVETRSSRSDETEDSFKVDNQNFCQGQGKYEKDTFENATTSPGDLHEGVKIIANMVKWLLTSFNVKIKKLIVAFDPDSPTKVDGFLKHKTLVLRVAEIECGTCVSEDANLGGVEEIDSFLGISRLTNYVTFEGAVLELIQMDDVLKQTAAHAIGKDSFEVPLDHFPASSKSLIMTGKRGGGVSGNLKSSIPWKNGSLDIRKVDAEVSIDPIEFRFQPSTIKWLLCSLEALKHPGTDEKTHTNIKPRENVAFNSTTHYSLQTPISPRDYVNNLVPASGGLPSDLSSLPGRGSAYDVKLPWVISDWVSSSVSETEPDFGASVDQFFECFDGMRNSQSALGASGMWNWTCSVFSAITAASSLASGSLHISSEQQHVETNFKAAITGISLIFSFSDEDELHTSELQGLGSYLHYLILECWDVHLKLQVCPRDLKFDGTVRLIELDHCITHRRNPSVFVDQNGDREFLHNTATIKQLQVEVQNALPQRASFFGIPDHRPTSMPYYEGPAEKKDDTIRIALLKTSGFLHCHCTMKYGLHSDKSNGAISFSVNLPPFVFWINFNLMVKLFTFMEEVQRFVESSEGESRSSCKVKQPSHENAKTGPVRPEMGGSETRFVTLSSEERLRGSVSIPNARIILCFPFHAEDDLLSYSSCNEFISLDLCSPLITSKGKSISLFPETNLDKRFSDTMTRSLYLNLGNLDIYLVHLGPEDCDVGSKSSDVLGKKFVSENIITTAGHSSIHMIWQEGPVTGPWIAERAKSLAWSHGSKNKNRFMGKGHDFASVTTMKDFDDSSSLIRQEIVLSAGFFLHAHLAPVVVNLGKSQYTCISSLLNQMVEGLSCGSNGVSVAKKESSGNQAAVLVECDSLEIVIKPEKLADVKSSMLSELPGSWCRMNLKIKKFELLNVSNIGGLDGANFFWLSHGEGKLCGSLSPVTDRDFLLISCTDSTMKRGDGEGSNALSSRLAGSDIIYLWEPRSSHGYTSIILKCATVVANGGRLDWVDSIASFFSSPSSETKKDFPAEPDGQSFSGFSFALNLVDVGLSYEPYLKNSVVEGEVAGNYVACLLAASSFDLSSTTVMGSVADDYNIRIQDLGFLLCSASKLELLGETYDAHHLRKVGYVKVAHEALIEVTLRMSARSEMLWQLECSNSQIDVETCGDTTMGLIKLAAQLQQLLGPDMEESLSHLQSRWDNLQKGEAVDSSYGKMRLTGRESASNSSTPQVRSFGASSLNEPAKISLMDEVCEDAFLLGEDHICQDYSETQLSAMLEESLLLDTCHYYSEAPEIVSPDISLDGTFMGSEDHKASELQKDYFPECIEGYCLSDLRSLSELTVGSRSSGETIKCNNLENVGMGGDMSGWYGDTSLMIVEDHISEASDLSSSRQSVQGDLANLSSTNSDDSSAVGSILVENINVRWRMYAGSDWDNMGNNSERPRNVSGRNTNVCLELVLSSVDCRYDMFPVGGLCMSKLSLSVKEVHLYDNSIDAPLKLVLGYYHSKQHPRESSSKAFKVELEAIRPDPSIPLEEYRLCISLLPLRLNLHQRQLDFFVNFFGGEEVSRDHPREKNSDGSISLLANGQDYSPMDKTVEEALLPFFQKFDMRPLLVRVDYIPERVDLAALRGGKYVELVNLVPWKGVELQLKHVHAVGVYGWNNVCETIIGEWLEDISQNQIHKVLRGIPTVRSLVSVGSAASKLVSCPLENYKKDHRVLKGVQRGTFAFLRSISLEAVGLGVHLAAGAHDILVHTECVLASIPSSAPWPGQSGKKPNVRSNQPKNAQQGIKKAYESLSDGLGKSASALVQTPIKKYQRGAGAGSAIATAFKAVPAATIAPVSACASAVHYALLGLRNSLDPEHKKDSMEKYLGPNPSQE